MKCRELTKLVKRFRALEIEAYKAKSNYEKIGEHSGYESGKWGAYGYAADALEAFLKHKLLPGNGSSLSQLVRRLPNNHHISLWDDGDIWIEGEFDQRYRTFKTISALKEYLMSQPEKEGRDERT
jgi:hypothetical protein